MNEIAASDISSVSTASSAKNRGGNFDLRTKVRELLELDNEILELKKKKSILDKQKKVYTTELLDWMKSEELGELSAANTFFTRKVMITKPLGKKSLIQVLKDYFKEEPQKGEAVKDFIFENLPEKKTEKLLRFEKDDT